MTKQRREIIGSTLSYVVFQKCGIFDRLNLIILFLAGAGLAKKLNKKSVEKKDIYKIFAKTLIVGTR